MSHQTWHLTHITVNSQTQPEQTHLQMWQILLFSGHPDTSLCDDLISSQPPPAEGYKMFSVCALCFSIVRTTEECQTPLPGGCCSVTLTPTFLWPTGPPGWSLRYHNGGEHMFSPRTSANIEKHRLGCFLSLIDLQVVQMNDFPHSGLCTRCSTWNAAQLSAGIWQFFCTHTDFSIQCASFGVLVSHN